MSQGRGFSKHEKLGWRWDGDGSTQIFIWDNTSLLERLRNIPSHIEGHQTTSLIPWCCGLRCALCIQEGIWRNSKNSDYGCKNIRITNTKCDRRIVQKILTVACFFGGGGGRGGYFHKQVSRILLNFQRFFRDFKINNILCLLSCQALVWPHMTSCALLWSSMTAWDPLSPPMASCDLL